MARSYSMEPQAAKEANQGGKRITDTGKYKGVIKAAWAETYQTGTEAVCLQFESNTGQEAGPLTLFTFNKEGEQLSGFKMFSAILACARLRGVQPQKGRVKLYDFEQKVEVEKEKDVFPELAGKPMGLLLQQEEYTDKDGYLRVDDSGAPKTRMRIYAPFEASTELMAAEVLDRQAQPVALGKALEWLAANPVRQDRNAKRPTQNSYSSPAPRPSYQSNSYAAAQSGTAQSMPTAQMQGQPPAGYDDYDDDIPF